MPGAGQGDRPRPSSPAASPSSPTRNWKTALDEARVPPRATDAIVEENEEARLVGLRTALAVLALLALVGLFFTGRIPTRQPGAAAEPAAAT